MRLLLRLGFEVGELRLGADFFKGSLSDERRFILRRMA
jgi:hypothetical protein